MTIFRSVLALFLILMTGTLFAAPKGGGEEGGPTDLMRGIYSCHVYSLPDVYQHEMNVQSATFIEPNDFSNRTEYGDPNCVLILENIDLLVAPYCQTDYLNTSNLLMVCRGTREEMVGLLGDLQEKVLHPTQ